MNFKKTLANIALAGAISLGIASKSNAEKVYLEFNSPVAGTIQDKNGLGSGLTHRLPGTGISFPSYDPNLDLSSNPGNLTVHSTHADIDPSYNLGELEAIGVYIPNTGTNDITISARFNSIQLGNYLSNQLMLYAGVSEKDVIRAGFHISSSSERSYIGTYKHTNDKKGFFGTDAGINFFSNGDNIILSLKRTNSLWELSWDNLTNTNADGSSGKYSFPWLDNTELYVGIHYANPRISNSLETSVDYFSVDFTPVPEPSNLTLLLTGTLVSIGIPGVYALKRKSKR